jgi:lipopolysaccharide transport system permease protein
MATVPEKWRFLIFLNPMSGIIEYSRYILLGIGGVTKVGFLYIICFSIVISVFGVLVFKTKEGEMVEDL